MKATAAQPIIFRGADQIIQRFGPSAGPVLLADLNETLARQEEVGYELTRLPACFNNAEGHNHLLRLDDGCLYLVRIEEK